MDPSAIADAIGIPVDRWPGRCHEIAAACLAARVVRGRLCYGHFFGPIAKTGLFAGRPFAHHGWVELRDGRIWDPTRWVFEDVAPYLYIGRDRDGHYDFGGNRLNEAMHGAYPPPSGAPLPLTLPRAVRTRVGAAIGQSGAWDRATTDTQVHWLANINIGRLAAGDCLVLYRAIIRVGMAASIPYDNRQRIMGPR